MPRGRKLIDITGQRFGRLVVLRYEKPKWICLCDCGKSVKPKSASLRGGFTRSCGCLRNEILLKIRVTHGYLDGLEKSLMKKGNDQFYHTWCSIRQRCQNKNNHAFPRYGGRGIKVCERWNEFKNFHDDMFASFQEHKKDNSYTSIDRIDPNGNYDPANCRWADRKVQARNRQNSFFITYKNVKYHRREFKEIYNAVAPIFNHLSRSKEKDITSYLMGDEIKIQKLKNLELVKKIKKEYPDRKTAIFKLRGLGVTFDLIGKAFGVTRQRAEQIFSKTF